MLKHISSGKAADASAHYDYIVAYRGGRASEDFAVADLMADVVVFALDGRSFGILCLRQQRKINWASGGNAAGYDEFNEVSAICAHEVSFVTPLSWAGATMPLPPVRRRFLLCLRLLLGAGTR